MQSFKGSFRFSRTAPTAALRDSLRAGGGADAIHARDGVADSVDGGKGQDSARVDRVDTVRAVERRF